MNKKAASGLNKKETSLLTTKSLSFNYKWESIRGSASCLGLRAKRSRKSACVAVNTSPDPLIDSSSTKAPEDSVESLSSQREARECVHVDTGPPAETGIFVNTPRHTIKVEDRVWPDSEENLIEYSKSLKQVIKYTLS